MLIAHISDFHVVPEPQLCYGYSNTRLSLLRTINRLNHMLPRPDIVIITGDLVDEPSPEAYETLGGILQKLVLPFLVIPGNHDDRVQLAALFPDNTCLTGSNAAANFIQTMGEGQDATRLIAFDAVVSGKEYAEITLQGLQWLESALEQTSPFPTMIAMHHPPVLTGLAFMDAFQPPLSSELTNLLIAAPHVKLIMCGHVHRQIDGMLGHARIASAGSTAHQFALATDVDSVPRLSGEPPLIRLHLWRKETVTSFTVPVDDNFAVHSFEGIDAASWKRIRESLRAGEQRQVGATIEEQ